MGYARNQQGAPDGTQYITALYNLNVDMDGNVRSVDIDVDLPETPLEPIPNPTDTTGEVESDDDMDIYELVPFSVVASESMTLYGGPNGSFWRSEEALFEARRDYVLSNAFFLWRENGMGRRGAALAGKHCGKTGIMG